MFCSRDLSFLGGNDPRIRMCSWPHAWKSTLTQLAKLCLSNCSPCREVLEPSWAKSLWGFLVLAMLQSPTATSRASPVLQPWKRQEKFYSSIQGKESDGAMGRLRKRRKAALIWWSSALWKATKSQRVFPLQEILEGIGYVTICSSLSVAACTRTCILYSWKPHPCEIKQWAPQYFLLYPHQL